MNSQCAAPSPSRSSHARLTLRSATSSSAYVRRLRGGGRSARGCAPRLPGAAAAAPAAAAAATAWPTGSLPARCAGAGAPGASACAPRGKWSGTGVAAPLAVAPELWRPGPVTTCAGELLARNAASRGRAQRLVRPARPLERGALFLGRC